MKDLGKRIGAYHELPKDLKQQLCLSANYELRILDVFCDLDGYATIDEIIVAFYKKFNVILRRRLLTSILYRMYLENKLNRIKGKKGAYFLNEPPSPQREKV